MGRREYDGLMDDELVTVRHCMSLAEAELVKSVLSAEGIEAEIPDEYAVGVQPFYGTMDEGVRVIVHASDLDRVVEALEAHA